MTDEDQPSWMPGMLADVELFDRMGAKQFEVGHLDDTPLAKDARWWASAMFRGAKVMVDEHEHTAEATRALAVKLLEGGSCVACGKTTTVRDPGEDRCRWYVADDHWLRGCDGLYGPVTEKRQEPGQPRERRAARRRRERDERRRGR